jgi:DNA-binding response OmpR family regulator
MAKTTVLYVEDDRDSAKLVAKTLHREGIAVLLAENGKDGYKIALQHQPDLILMDFNLPDVNGVEVMRHLKTTADTLHIPVVMLTVDDGHATRHYAHEVGCDGYLVKPASRSALLNLVNALAAAG